MEKAIEILLIGGPRDGDIAVLDRDDSYIRFRENKVSSNRSSKATPLLSKDYTKREITIDGKRYAYGFCENIEESEAEMRIKATKLKPI